MAHSSKEYMRDFRKKQKIKNQHQKEKLDFYEKTFGLVEWETI